MANSYGRRRVPHSGYYGGARDFRGAKRAKPAFYRTEQFDAPKHDDGSKTYVTKRRMRRRAKP